MKRRERISLYSDKEFTDISNHHGEKGAYIEEAEVMLMNGNSQHNGSGMQKCQQESVMLAS